MHFSTAISLLVGATCVASFHIPSNVTDGVYSVFTHENGTEVHTRIGDLLDPNINTLVPSSKFKRQNTDWTTTTCYPQEGTQDLDHRTCDAANATLDAQCGGGANVGSGMDFYSISECVVAYMCNFGWASRNCYASDRGSASARITKNCGWYKPGSARYNSVSPLISYAYGYESYCTAQGHNFCGRGA